MHTLATLPCPAHADSAGSENFGDDVVNVLTYHKAKGPEWPAVAVASLDTDDAAKSWAYRLKECRRSMSGTPSTWAGTGTAGTLVIQGRDGERSLSVDAFSYEPSRRTRSRQREPRRGI